MMRFQSWSFQLKSRFPVFWKRFSFLKKVFIFQKICFKVKVIKTLIVTDRHIKTCRSLKRRAILKSLVPFFRRTYALSVCLKMKHLINYSLRYYFREKQLHLHVITTNKFIFKFHTKFAMSLFKKLAADQSMTCDFVSCFSMMHCVHIDSSSSPTVRQSKNESANWNSICEINEKFNKKR